MDNLNVIAIFLLLLVLLAFANSFRVIWLLYQEKQYFYLILMSLLNLGFAGLGYIMFHQLILNLIGY